MLAIDDNSLTSRVLCSSATILTASSKEVAEVGKSGQIATLVLVSADGNLRGLDVDVE